MDISRFELACERLFDLSNLQLSHSYHYNSIACCIVDAVYSIGVRYQSTENTVASFCKYAGIEPKGLHCLRHTCASHLFAATNGNAVAVSELLRHTDVSFTEKYYIDIINEYRKQIISEFEI